MKKVYPILLILFSVFWVAFVLLDYLQKHPQYALNIQFFQYWDLYSLAIGHALLGGGLYAFYKAKISSILRGGLMLIPGVILVGITFALVLNRGTDTSAAFNEILFILFNYFLVGLQVFFIILSTYSIGSWALTRFRFKLDKSSTVAVSIAAGIMIVVMLAFLLGIFKILYWFTLGPILIGCLALGFENNLRFLKRISIDVIKPSKSLGFIGAFSLLLLLFVVQLNLAQNISPFPKGWDSMALYVKLPTIINDYHGLVRGYQPYNWSLFMSFGLILFNSLETVLALSYVGGVLCLLALYAIGKDILKMNQNYTLLSLLVFYLIPSVGFQSYQEQKVDLGLLFIVLSLVILLFAWIKENKKILTPDSDSVVPQGLKLFLNPYLVLMGLLTGFAFGIKLTTLFTYFCIVAIMWFVEFGFLGFLGAAFLCCFAILLVKLDDMSGMREYHLSANYVQWALLLIGAGSFAYLFIQNSTGFIRTIKYSLVYSIFFGLMAMPWVTKNFIDSDMKISFQYILNGKTNTPPANLKYLKNKYERQQKRNGN